MTTSRKKQAAIFRACPVLLVIITVVVLPLPASDFAQLTSLTDVATPSTLDTATLLALDTTTLSTTETVTSTTSTVTSTVSSTTDTLSSTTSTVTSTLSSTDTSLLPPLPVPEVLPLPGLQLPQVSLDTTLPPIGLTFPSTAPTIFVPAGGDLQSALNNAQPGNIIALEAGATFTGNFVLPNKGGTDWIMIRSAAPDSSLPPPGTRITPAYSGVLPKIVTPNTSPAIIPDLGANHYRFIGVEITTTHTDTASTVFNLVWLEYTGGQTSLSQVPTDIIFDRCYIHGTPTGNVRRGIAINSARTAIVDSYLSDFHEVGADAQAILGWNGPGPFKIANNYLEASGENIMFGGGDPAISNLVPSDIEIHANHFFKPLKWRVGDPSYAGIHWSIKNLFELKNAQRVLIDGNVFEYNWADAQAGFAIQLTPRNQDGTAPWSVVQDVTFTNNIVRHTGSGVNFLGFDNLQPSQQLQRVLIQNNLFEDVSGAVWGGNGILFQLLGETANVVINHNTGFQDGNIIMADGSPPNTGFVYENNITPHNLFGVIGTGTGVGNGTLTTYFPGSVFVDNVLAGGNASLYPAGNFFPASLADVGFVDLSGGSLALAAASPYVGGGTDGKDIGADMGAIDGATAGIAPLFTTTAAPTSNTTSVAPNSAPISPLLASSPADPPPDPALPGSGSGGGGGGGCFIATAAFGSALEPQVVLLREFRDRYLIRSSLGLSFVRWYYRTSPPIADRIRESPALRGMVQALLWPLVGVAWLALNPGMGAGILIGFGGLTTWLWLRRKCPLPKDIPPL